MSGSNFLSKVANLRVASLSKGNKSLMLGVLANFIGKLWVLLIQIANLAILPAHWGASQYGVWLVLTAVPAYIALGGLGFGNAAATDMTANVARGNYGQALKDFQSVWVLVTVMTVGITVLAGAICWGTQAVRPEIALAGEGEVALSAAVLGLYSLVVIQTSIVQTGFRSTGKYALGTFAMDIITLFEGIAGLSLVAFWSAGFVAVALAMLAVRAAGHLVSMLLLYRLEPWCRLGIGQADFATIKRLTKPALGSLGLLAATALSLQGVITAIGLFISPTEAAIYGSARTLCRLPLQISDLLGRASLPELTSAQAKGDRKRFLNLTLLNLLTAAAVTVPFLVLLTLFGMQIAGFISRGSIPFDNPALFAALSSATAAQALWAASGQTMQAVNRHHLFSFPYVLIAACTALSPLVMGYTSSPLVNVAVFSCLAEFSVFAITTYFTLGIVRAVGKHGAGETNLSDRPPITRKKNKPKLR